MDSRLYLLLTLAGYALGAFHAPLPAHAGAGDLTRARLETLPRLPGLYGVLGLGARGLAWAAAAADLVASELEGEPLPLESDLAAAVDPARFLLRAARRGRLRWLGEDEA